MKTPVTSSTTMIISGLGALALLGALSGCGSKTDDTQNQAASNATASSPAANESDSAAAAADDNMAGEMEEHHRQEMDHRDMRKGGPMMPEAAPATDTPSNSQAAPMKDM